MTAGTQWRAAMQMVVRGIETRVGEILYAETICGRRAAAFICRPC